jgi:hypothetical protein
MIASTQPPPLWINVRLFIVMAQHNFQNERAWCRKNEDITVDVRTAFQRQMSASEMMWTTVSSNGQKMPIFLFQEGIKMNKHV